MHLVYKFSPKFYGIFHNYSQLCLWEWIIWGFSMVPGDRKSTIKNGETCIEEMGQKLCK